MHTMQSSGQPPPYSCQSLHVDGGCISAYHTDLARDVRHVHAQHRPSISADVCASPAKSEMRIEWGNALIHALIVYGGVRTGTMSVLINFIVFTF